MRSLVLVLLLTGCVGQGTRTDTTTGRNYQLEVISTESECIARISAVGEDGVAVKDVVVDTLIMESPLSE